MEVADAVRQNTRVCCFMRISDKDDMFRYPPFASKEAKITRTGYSVSATTCNAPVKSGEAFTVLGCVCFSS